MRLFNNRMTPGSASRIADYALEQMDFNNPEREVDISSVHQYLTQVVMDYDTLIAKVEKRSMVKGAVLMAGALYVAKKLTEAKEEEEE